MFQKPQKSKALCMFEVLRKRMELDAGSRATFERLQRGHHGECDFADFLERRFKSPCIQLYDLQLKIGGSECQIDCLLIFQNEIYQFEIKNFQGDYFCQNNEWYTVTTRKQIRNPLHQLNRSDLLLREYLSEKHASLQLHSYILFINPGFQLYQAPLKTPMIFASQLERFIRKLQRIPCQLGPQHQNLAEDLRAAHLGGSAYEQLPAYQYEQLTKGITCEECTGLMVLTKTARQVICNICQTVEKIDSAVLRQITAFSILFPGKPINVSNIHAWCNSTVQLSSIRRILRNQLTLIKNGKHSYYVFNSKTE